MAETSAPRARAGLPIIAIVAMVGLAAVLLACSEPPRPAAADARPSFLLVVIDTLRVDAVSAYGSEPGTVTPALDALAREGLRYARAYAPAPWTLPSHATLFTGVGPGEHGVGVGGHMVLPERFETLAERLAGAGYDTIGFAENSLVVPAMGLAQGFRSFVSEGIAVTLRKQGHEDVQLDVVQGVRDWSQQRDPQKPFLVFANLFDAHDPYELHPEHDFLPPGVPPERAERLGRGEPGEGVAEFAGICERLPPPDEIEILRALYRGEVAAADAKLGRLVEAARAAAGDGPLVTVVTSDHGEHFGEHGLLGHEFSLRGSLLHVPLVVHGLPDTEPAVIETPVSLADVVPSVLAWAGLEPPEDVAGRALPRAPGAPAPEDRPLLAAWSDAPLVAPQGWFSDEDRAGRRRSCTDEHRVFGDMVSLVRFPYKVNWYAREGVAPELYDLRWDQAERSDVSGHQAERLDAMLGEIERERQALEEVAERPREPLDPEVVQTLRALGYAE